MKHLFYALGRRTLMLAMLVGFCSATWAERKHYYYDFEGNYLSDNATDDVVKNTESVVDYEFDADTETLYLCKSLYNIYKDITLVMPLDIDDKPVTTIATGAFSESTYKYGINVNAREIVFPPNVRNLESDIFNGGSAAYVIDLSMSNINNMNIHDDAFSGCYNLLGYDDCYLYYSDGDCTNRYKARAHDVCYSICPKTKQLEMTYFDSFIGSSNVDGSRTIAKDIMGTNCKLNGCLKGKSYLRSLQIGEGLTSLGDEEFKGCTDLESLVLPKTFDLKNYAAETASTCGDRVFDGCENLVCIYVFSNGVPYLVNWATTDGDLWAYVNNGSEMVKDPVLKNRPNRMLTDTDSKIAIYPDIQFVKGYVARFYNRNLWYNAFKDNTNITEVTIYGKRDAKSNASLVRLLDSCFEGCTSLEKVVSLSDELGYIGENCFKNCPKLNYMSFARDVSVDTGAFDGDDNLTTIQFVKDSTDVGLRYHYTWTKATSITLPDATFKGQTVADNMPEGPKTLLRRIEKTGDATDTADNRIYDPANNVPAFAPKAGISAPLYMMCDDVFRENYQYSAFNLPAETTLFGNDCFNVYNGPLKLNLTYNGLRYESKYLTGDNTGCMSATLTDIPDHDVTDLVIPYDFKVSNVTCFTNAIAESVGKEYTALKTLEFAPSTKIYNAGASYSKGLEIGGSAFSGCRALTTLSLPAGTKEYTYKLTGTSSADAGAFSDCTSLRSVDLTNCTDIWYRAFNNCTSLRSVRFGSKLANASLAFHGCSSLTSVVFPNTVSTTYDAFKGCDKLKAMVYTFNKTDADKYATALQYAKDLVAYVAKNRGLDTDDLKVYVPADNLQDFDGIQGVVAAAMTDYRFLPTTASDGTQLVEGYGTVCLPSAIDIAASYNIKGLYKAQLNSDNTAVTLAEQTQDDVVAGMPYVFARNNSGSASADADNLVVFVAKDGVAKAEFPVVDAYNNILRGTFSGMSAKDGDYVLQSDNKFHVVNTSVYRASVGAYRAYINGLNVPASASTASMFALNIGGSATGVGGINASGNAGANAADTKIYTIDGQRVYAPVKGQVYIIGGKKRVY